MLLMFGVLSKRILLETRNENSWTCSETWENQGKNDITSLLVHLPAYFVSVTPPAECVLSSPMHWLPASCILNQWLGLVYFCCGIDFPLSVGESNSSFRGSEGQSASGKGSLGGGKTVKINGIWNTEQITLWTCVWHHTVIFSSTLLSELLTIHWVTDV